jgi:hypothetical protein
MKNSLRGIHNLLEWFRWVWMLLRIARSWEEFKRIHLVKHQVPRQDEGSRTEPSQLEYKRSSSLERALLCTPEACIYLR